MKKTKPSKKELREAAVYVKKQFRVMFPGKKPYRHPAYKTTVLTVAQHAADVRGAFDKMQVVVGGRRSGKRLMQAGMQVAVRVSEKQ